MRGRSIFALGAALALAACGTTTQDRAISGGAIGAGAGAVLSAITPIGLVGGMLLGGAAGAATGAVTTKEQVNLGEPAWKHGGQNGAIAQPPATAGDVVRDIQLGLQRLGYDPGPADGRLGPKTEAAIRRYQQDNHLPVDGRTSAALLQDIRHRT
jgi:hypothetical protein